MKNNLPDLWEKVFLGDIASIKYGADISIKKISKEGKFPVFGANGIIGYYNTYLYKEPQILISCRGAKSGTINYSPPFCYITHNSLITELPKKFIHLKNFLYFALLATDKSQIITGSAQPQVTIKNVVNLSIPLAPLNEQHRIVAKLEKLLTKVDQCQARLEKIPGILKRLRTAIIAGACAGILTNDWREVNPSVQGAAHVLEDNNKRRTQKYQKACQEAEQAGKPKPREYRVNNEPIDDSEYKWLPETWKLERLCNIAQICGGVTKGRKLKNRTTITLPYLRVANVQDGYLDLSEIKHIEALPEDLDKYGLKKGDVLFTEGGDRDKLGRGTVWNDEIEDCIHQNHVFRARLYSSSILPEYVSLATKSEQSKNFFFKNASQTVNLASINMTSLGNLPIPIPPYEEQKEIIKRVKRLYEIAGQLEKRYSKGKIHIDHLTQSILAKAFRGELVPQDPDDEPAAELLERIKKEKERQSFRNNSKRNSKNQNQKKKARA